ncbi:MAG: hypothetical protein IT215_00630 [Chitinophagaceae bacterium]|nr:hypothetical protein [Chitinophagaceae bacterium]
MKHEDGYPKLCIRSKNELAKHISHKGFLPDEALALINNVKSNFNDYWKDSKKASKPQNDKYVRNAKGSPLGKLLRKIDRLVLTPHDSLLPNFIFGGVKGKNHAMAAYNLLGNKRRRRLLKIDISRFYERVELHRVINFFQYKCGCQYRAAKLLAEFCSVPFGAKDSKNPRITIARGFATSSRLAIWCNLGVFKKMERLVMRRLKGHDPRISVYVDDIGITSSGVTKEQMENLRDEVIQLLQTHDKNQPLPVNKKKTAIQSHEEGLYILGIKLNRNNLTIGRKTHSRIHNFKHKLKVSKAKKERDKLKQLIRGISRYKNYVENM